MSASMIGDWATVIVGCIALIVVGYLHGANMYDLGRRHGRQEEAMKARHDRERMAEHDARVAMDEYIDSQEAH